ncbi:putative serine/threonine protein kinase [Blattamonas nauphoetae]|uniref:non-specific serine/threonine protein kinase n=1 Tax=Blattamonas nauphoetae TaxID=2049346 RepID=A0ABQ9XJR9_9EUKA|nr:putative serine/threonine protein kinase [Blattamonas nauphoetae]
MSHSSRINHAWTLPTDEKVKNFTSSIVDFYRELVQYLSMRRLRAISDLKYIESANLQGPDRDHFIQKCQARDLATIRLSRGHMTPSSFDWLAMLGAGAFAQVFLCRHKKTKILLAIKKIHKSVLNSEKAFVRLRTERAVSGAGKNPWLVKLYYFFQDKEYFYMAMEFVQGGDFGNLLQNCGCLDEEIGVYYFAQMICAVHSLHKSGFIHRDLKPANFLIDSKGRIKLADFGLAKGNPDFISNDDIYPTSTELPLSSKLQNGTQNSAGSPVTISTAELTETIGEHSSDWSQTFADLNSQNAASLSNTLTSQSQSSQPSMFPHLSGTFVGTPDYLAPEISNQEDYSELVDYWSLGCILYEMLTGSPPFTSDCDNSVIQKSTHWKETLKRPEDISDEAWDMITHLICDKSTRYGRNGVREIGSHPLFTKNGISWADLRTMDPPFVPELSSETDLTYFDNAILIDVNIGTDKEGMNAFPEEGTTPQPTKEDLSNRVKENDEMLRVLSEVDDFIVHEATTTTPEEDFYRQYATRISPILETLPSPTPSPAQPGQLPSPNTQLASSASSHNLLSSQAAADFLSLHSSAFSYSTPSSNPFAEYEQIQLPDGAIPIANFAKLDEARSEPILGDTFSTSAIWTDRPRESLAQTFAFVDQNASTYNLQAPKVNERKAQKSMLDTERDVLNDLIGNGTALNLNGTAIDMVQTIQPYGGGMVSQVVVPNTRSEMAATTVTFAKKKPKKGKKGKKAVGKKTTPKMERKKPSGDNTLETLQLSLPGAQYNERPASKQKDRPLTPKGERGSTPKMKDRSDRPNTPSSTPPSARHVPSIGASPHLKHLAPNDPHIHAEPAPVSPRLSDTRRSKSEYEPSPSKPSPSIRRKPAIGSSPKTGHLMRASENLTQSVSAPIPKRKDESKSPISTPLPTRGVPSSPVSNRKSTSSSAKRPTSGKAISRPTSSKTSSRTPTVKTSRPVTPHARDGGDSARRSLSPATPRKEESVGNSTKSKRTASPAVPIGVDIGPDESPKPKKATRPTSSKRTAKTGATTTDKKSN